MDTELRVLIVEDSEDDALLLLRELKKGGYVPVYERVDTAESMASSLENGSWELVISDYVMPKFSGLDALSLLRENDRDLPFIVVSGNIGEDMAVEAMRAGAQDYIIKGNYKRLVPAVKRELEEARQRSEKRKIEEQLNVSEERFRKRYEAIAAGVIVSNTRGEITHVNKAACRYLGMRTEEMVGSESIEKIWRAVREDMSRITGEEYPSAITLSSGKAVQSEVMGILDENNGLAYWVLVDCEPIYDPMTGRIEEILTSFVDVSMRKSVEEELRKRNELLQLVMDNIPQSIFWKDLKGQYLGCNRNFLNDASVLSPEEIIGRTTDEILWSKVDVRKLCILEEKVVRKNYPELHANLHVGDRMDEKIWIDGSAVPLHDADGGVVGVLGLYEDITGKRKAEEELRERREQERRIHAEAESAKREFYRKTISSVTDGRLNLVGYSDIEELLIGDCESFYLDKEEGLSKLRKCVEKTCTDIDLSDDQAYAVVVAAGEAAANAIKHAKGGQAAVYRHQNSIRILVKDAGQGMDALILPRATLQKMFSTTMSMGLGYSLILASVDRVYLATDTNGTWILMEKSVSEPQEQPDTGIISDSW